MTRLVVHFRKRLSPEVLIQINEWIILAQEEAKADEEQEPKDGPGDDGAKETSAVPKASLTDDSPRQGKLLLDATCAPADIAHPTDLSLLNEAREKLDDIIDTLLRSGVR